MALRISTILISFVLCRAVFLIFASIPCSRFIKSSNFANDSNLIYVKESKTRLACILSCVYIESCSMVSMTINDQSHYQCRSYKLNSYSKMSLVNPLNQGIWYKGGFPSIGNLITVIPDCPIGFMKLNDGDRCYHMMTNHNITWEQGKTYCEEITIGSHLIEFSDIPVCLFNVLILKVFL